MIEAVIEEDDIKEIEVYLSEKPAFKPADPDDPFNTPASDLKKYVNLDGSPALEKNFVRRTDRRLRKDYNISTSDETTGYTGANNARSKQINIEAVIGYTYLECVLPPYNLSWLAQLYDKSPAHHAAVNAKVESVFGLGYDWIESPKTKMARNSIRTDGGLSRLESTLAKEKFNIQQWLESTNNEEPFEEVMQKLGRDYESTGNAYLEIGRDKKGNIGYIGHVPSAYVRVRKNRDGYVQIFSNHVVYFRNFGAKNANPITDDANPNELIHFKKYSPGHMYYGIPDIISAQNPLAGNEFASRYNLDFFENKAIPRHVIIAKGVDLTANSRNKLVQFFEAGLRGQHHRSIYIPLPAGDQVDLKFESIEEGTQDSSFSNYRKDNNSEIFMAHRTPPTRAGVFEGNIALAAAQEADKVFKETYSSPEQAIFEKKIKRLFAEVTDMFVFTLNELSLTDANTQSQIDERDIRNQVKVPNEVRAGRGLGPRPDGKGNEPFSPTAQKAADMRANATQSRKRDADRSANRSDDINNATGRNAKGSGRRAA